MTLRTGEGGGVGHSSLTVTSIPHSTLRSLWSTQTPDGGCSGSRGRGWRARAESALSVSRSRTRVLDRA